MLDDRDKRSSLRSKDEFITERIHPHPSSIFVCVFIECEWALASSNHSRSSNQSSLSSPPENLTQ
eukprot:scaffold7258_cov80-Skeletonema_dohrnii-CCMP3373.AAC.1